MIMTQKATVEGFGALDLVMDKLESGGTARESMFGTLELSTKVSGEATRWKA